METKILSLKSDPAALAPFRTKMRKLLEKEGFSPKDKESVLLALGEACTNATRHAYGGDKTREILVTVENAEDKVVFKIRDYGTKIDLSKVCPPQLPPQKGGGLGIYFMKESVDEMEYNTSHPEGNELILIKYKVKGESA